MKIQWMDSHSAAGGAAVGLIRDDVCSDVYRYYFCTNCAGAERRRTFDSWVILIGCAKTDEPITGNITGSFCIFLLANPAWPSYRRIARSISNKSQLFVWKVTIIYQCHIDKRYKPLRQSWFGLGEGKKKRGEERRAWRENEMGREGEGTADDGEEIVIFAIS